MKKVRVKWHDSVSMNGWQPRRTVNRFIKDGLHVMESTGYLYKKSKEIIILVQSVHDSGDSSNYSETLMIPAKCVISIKKIK